MEETCFDKNIHNHFEDIFGDALLKVSTNYVDSLRLLDNHLKAIYGSEIDRSQILARYREASPTITSVDDLEEVSESFLCELIREEDEQKAKIERLQEINGILSDENRKFDHVDNEKTILLSQAADLIGLTGKDDGLMKNVLHKDYRFVERPEPFGSLTTALYMIVNEVSKLYSSGMQLSFPNTKSVAMTQQKGRCFYRGENAYYGTSKAGCYRGKSWSELKEPGWERILWNLRLYECFGFFDRFDVVKHWRYSEVNYMALVQHYGLKTPLLDITTNLKTALFFACCKADVNGLEWHPLTKEDFEKRDSRKNIAALGGDSRYAVLYNVPTDIVDCQWMTRKENEAANIITPIGYQPFMRCSTQYGYMMSTVEDYDLMQDKLFRKVKFRLTEDFCRWIYEEMDCGKAIYPNDRDIARIQDIVHVVSRMNTRTEFSRVTAENVRRDIASALSENPDDEFDPVYFYSNLRRLGIRIKDRVELLSDKNIGRINERYTIDMVESRMELPRCNPMLVVG